MLVSIEPDLDVNLAVCQPLERQPRDFLPHSEGLLDSIVNIRVTEAARGGVSQDPAVTVTSVTKLYTEEVTDL